jgi:hypothetical protein
MRHLRFLTIAVMPVLSGCVPFPVHKTLQPAAKLTVLDSSGLPMENAEVQLVSNAHPYGWEKRREVQRTDAGGEARFDSRREWRAESLMIHGWEEYFWNWCVRAEGHATFFTANTSGRQFEENLVVQLMLGESSPCPKAFR